MSSHTAPPANSTTSRIRSLDLLRGYFIVVIVLDHLSKYPSLWSFITGQGLLWVTAAEGFVMISGFLVGYIRGFKGLKKSFAQIASLLLKRAAVLYIWMLIVSMGYLYIEWNNFLPVMPHTDLATRSYWDAFVAFATTGKPHVWIHFLYLYSIFLVLSVGAVALLRRRLPWLLVLSTLALYLGGLMWDVEWMKWQVLFFLPSVAGFYFDSIQNWWSHLPATTRMRLQTGVYVSALVTVLLSVYITFSPTIDADTKLFIRVAFSPEMLAPLKVILAGIWFVALAFLFERFGARIHRYTFGALEYIGQHSLTAYIIHGYVICLVNFVFYYQITDAWQYLYFTLLGLITLLIVYGCMRLPIVRRVIPK